MKAAPPAATFKEEQRTAERVTLLRRRDASYGPHADKTVGELLQRLFDEDGDRWPNIAESVMEQVAQDLYTLEIAIQMGRDALDNDAVALRLARLRTKLEIGIELAQRDRVVNPKNPHLDDETEVAS